MWDWSHLFAELSPVIQNVWERREGEMEEEREGEGNGGSAD